LPVDFSLIEPCRSPGSLRSSRGRRPDRSSTASSLQRRRSRRAQLIDVAAEDVCGARCRPTAIGPSRPPRRRTRHGGDPRRAWAGLGSAPNLGLRIAAAPAAPHYLSPSAPGGRYGAESGYTASAVTDNCRACSADRGRACGVATAEPRGGSRTTGDDRLARAGRAEPAPVTAAERRARPPNTNARAAWVAPRRRALVRRGGKERSRMPSRVLVHLPPPEPPHWSTRHGAQHAVRSSQRLDRRGLPARAR
jgi:hypothetical protein